MPDSKAHEATFGVVCDRCGKKIEEPGETIGEAFDKLHEKATELGWRIADRSRHGQQALVEAAKITGHATSHALKFRDLCPLCANEEND